MHTKKGRVPLVLVLMLMLTLGGAPASEAAGGMLSDIQGHWAQQVITEMNDSEIISGYPDGVFQPDKSVTRLEAVAMLIRVLGLEDQAKTMDKAEVDYKMPPDLFWGKGYLIMGVQRGILNKDHLNELQPASPATRLEVALLVYHALKLTSGDSTLAFTDSDQIPQEYRECVAAVTKSNIMQGFPGYVFKPGDEINRAQMAAVLSRIVENNFAGETVKARRSSGTLSSVSSEDSTHWLLSVNGSSKTAESGCDVFLDGKSAELADLRAGDEVKLVLNKNDQVVFINASRVSVAQEYKGKVSSVLDAGGGYWLGIVDFDGNSLTRPVAGGVQVNESGVQKDLSSLSTGKYVEIKVAGNKITGISVLDTSVISGTVSSRLSNILVVTRENGVIAEMDVPSSVVVTKGGSSLSYNDIKEGNRVEVTMYDNKALRIDVQ